MLKSFQSQHPNRLWRCPTWLLTLLVCGYLLAAFNSNLFETVYELNGASGWTGAVYISSLYVFLLAGFYLALNLLTLPWLTKPLLISLIVGSAFAAYFMQAYNIVIDATMIQNTVETDIHESTELLNGKLLLYIAGFGLLPAWLVWKTEINHGSLLSFIGIKLGATVVSLAVIGLVAISFYQDYASLFRNNRFIRDLIVPVNYLHASQSYLKQQLPSRQPSYTTIGDDAKLGQHWQQANRKRVVSVLIVGETARSANFSLFGYPRITNPELAQRDIISFSAVSACGTSTAVSVPCMFSPMDRDNYNNVKANYSDSVLDLLQRAGLRVVWLDNNSGCKGVCNRVNFESLSESNDDKFCDDGECYDEILRQRLETIIDQSDDDIVLVLHQKGSHGPAYFLRTPAEFRQFTPLCHTNQLQECTQQEITNAYDNTILYTDFAISKVLDALDSRADAINANLIYISDHGESLGENNLYLHGLPYMIAPDEQKQVPMLMWFSDNFSRQFSLDTNCLNARRDDVYSHDNLFDSMLGLLDINTSAYRPGHDLFAPCKTDAIAFTANATNGPNNLLAERLND